MGALVFGFGALAHSTLLAHGHHDVRYEMPRIALSLNYKSKPKWADSGAATSDAELQVGPGGAQGASPAGRAPGDDLQSLCEQGQLDRALDTLWLMDQQGAVPSVNMYRSVLRACAKKKDLVQAKHVHTHLSRHGLEDTKVLGEDLISTLVKCGATGDALELFYRLPHRSVFSWTALISGYANSGQGRVALRVYQRMREEGVQPNAHTFVSLLKACGSVGDLGEGKRIHAEASNCNCHTDLFVRTCLVDMYGKCGSIVDAECVYNGISQHDVVAWNAMLAAYVGQRQPERALELFERMRGEGLTPNNVTFLSALQACGMLGEKEEDVKLDGRSPRNKYLERGKALHADISRSGYSSNIFVGSTLVSMYGKCGSVVDAQTVFNGLPQRNTVAWTAMLTAYVHQGYEEKALQGFEQMQEEGLSPDARTFVSVLQACGMLAQKEKNVVHCGESMKVKCLRRGKAIHADARRKGYDSDVFVGNTLISMYSRCNSIMDSQGVFDSLSQCDVVSWNAILSAYIEHGQGDTALQLYEQMLENGHSPNTWTFVSALQACSMLADEEAEVVVDGQSTKVASLALGKSIHADAWRIGFDSDVLVENNLITMYAKCRSIVDTQNVFDGLSRQNVVAWTAMLGLCVEQGQADRALRMYQDMEEVGVSPNDRTIVSMLQACSLLAEKEEGVVINGGLMKVRSFAKGKTIHADARRREYCADVFVSNALVSMYGKCGSIVDMHRVFDGMSERNVVTWTGMLMAYVEQGRAREAWQLYKDMQQQSVSPDVWASVSALQACAVLAEREVHVLVDGRPTKVESLDKGKAIQADVRRRGYNSNIFIVNTLISMYGKCGSIVDSQSIFDGLSPRNVVSWNALLAAFVEQGQAAKAVQVYNHMQKEGVSPNNRTFVSVLQAYGMMADCEHRAKCLENVEALHAAAQRKGYDLDAFVAGALVSVYGKYGSIVDARAVFDGLLQQNVVSRNTMLAAYVEQGQAEMALQLYRQGQQEWVSADEITLVCILQACSKIGSLHLVRQIHQTHVSSGNQLSRLLGNTVISAYGRCASMVDAQAVFNALRQPDVVSWTALIAGYARQGPCMVTLNTYRDMQLAGVNPDAVTFRALLSACSHAGLVDKGIQYFESMTTDHGIAPEIEHFATMVDLFGRAGCFTRLKHLLVSMPMEPDLAIWLSVLGSCQKHGQVVLGEQAFHHAVHLEPKESAPYVLLYNIFSEAGLVTRANQVMALRQKVGACQKPGQSWIGEEHETHTFLAGDWNHTKQEQLYNLLGKVSLTLKVEKPFSPYLRTMCEGYGKPATASLAVKERSKQPTVAARS